MHEIYRFIEKVGQNHNKQHFKSPNDPWSPQELQILPHPAIYTDDFNSHHELRKYRISDQDSGDRMKWAEDSEYKANLLWHRSRHNKVNWLGIGDLP